MNSLNNNAFVVEIYTKTRDLEWGAGMRHKWDYDVKFWDGTGDETLLVKVLNCGDEQFFI